MSDHAKPEVDPVFANIVEEYRDVLFNITELFDEADEVKTTANALICLSVMIALLIGETEAKHGRNEEEDAASLEHLFTFMRLTKDEAKKVTQWINRKREFSDPSTSDLDAVEPEVESFLNKIFKGE